ncbi:MAG: flagellar biosynthesis protein FlhA [Planctomycetota bacterium]
MATTIPASSSGGVAAFWAVFERYKPLLVPIAVIGMIAVIVVPLPIFLMDALIAANIGIAALILMTVIFVKSPLEFSVFPSVLLGTTLLRLVLNIATTRMILSADAGSGGAAAGKVIEAFAEFVAGSSVVVGVILFLILIIVQFVVITKGATRISEVAARFTLDGMPGKQMAIDADLNAGLIDEQGAKARREQISQEADFYGAMDGAAKFVRGDAIAGIIITLVNILGGFAVGVALSGMPVGEAVEVFTRLTIGDGLVSQLPALVISIAAALIVTRSGSRADLGEELTGQLATRSSALWITAGFLAAMSLTGLPATPMLTLAAIIGTVAFFAGRNEKEAQAAATTKQAEEAKAAPPDQMPIEQALHVDTLELEVGYQLVELVDTTRGGDLLERITMTRRTLAAEQGLVMPPVRIRDNMQLGPNEYCVKIRGNAVATGQVYPGKYLAMDGGLGDPDAEPLPGIRTKEPAFGLDAVWIDAGLRDLAEQQNCTAVDATSVLSTHLTEVVKNHAAEMLDYEETTNLVTQLREKAPKLCEAVLGPAGTQTEPPLIKTNELQAVLQNLLRERVPIRDLASIVETLGQWATRTKDLDVLTEYVRNELRRTICTQYAVVEAGTDESGLQLGPNVTKLYCVSLDPALEDLINGYIERGEQGTSLTLPPAVANRVTAALLQECQTLMNAGRHPVVLASPQVRAQVRGLIEPHLPTCAVLGYNEVSKGVEVESLGLVQLENQASAGVAGGQDDDLNAVSQDADSMGGGNVNETVGVGGAGIGGTR